MSGLMKSVIGHIFIHYTKRSLKTSKPHLIGLDGVVLSSKESNLLGKNERITGQPDGLMFDPHTQTLYHIEYKCNHTDGQRLKAMNQLQRDGYRLKSIFPEWDIIQLYVSEQYKVERI